MRKSVTQQSEYGCGVACFAFVCELSYEQAVVMLGREYSVKSGWRPSDLVAQLRVGGRVYKNSYVRKQPSSHYTDNSIVLIERSVYYPVGHYLVAYQGMFMDPWINLPTNTNITEARSGFRSKLPGRAMYVLAPRLDS